MCRGDVETIGRRCNEVVSGGHETVNRHPVVGALRSVSPRYRDRDSSVTSQGKPRTKKGMIRYFMQPLGAIEIREKKSWTGTLGGGDPCGLVADRGTASMPEKF